MQSTKRVISLYRVSTIGQVEKSDIPMQKQCCHEFISKHDDWLLVKEVYEKGVSGYKKSAKSRDAIREIQQDAVEGAFDILLVYMFDRLGRKDDETPFIVEWFVQQGIEVWSVIEGQQRFDNHVDKLLNYIRYWQASGESIKTSVRVRTRLEQLTQTGHYTGGSVPFGYRLEKQGRVNRKNQEVHDIVIDVTAAEVVRLIFRKYVYEGFGAQRISKFLREERISKNDGTYFINSSIIRILRRKLYTGYIQNGAAESVYIPDLQIIDSGIFHQAQALMQARSVRRNDVPLNLVGQSLLVGNIFCGHCHNKLVLSTSGRKRIRKDGTVYSDTRSRYTCHYRVRHPDRCNGQSGYGVKKLDAIIEQAVMRQLNNIRAMSKSEYVMQHYSAAIAQARNRFDQARAALTEKKRELEDYQNEVIRVIRGESEISPLLLNDLVSKAKYEVAELDAIADSAKKEWDCNQHDIASGAKEYERLCAWASTFELASFSEKKMITLQLIRSVHVHSDYSLKLEFNISLVKFRYLTVCNDKQAAECTVTVS